MQILCGNKRMKTETGVSVMECLRGFEADMTGVLGCSRADACWS